MLNEAIAADLEAKAAVGRAGVDSWSSRAEITKAINTLSQMVHNTAVEHGWWEDGERNFGEMLMLMTSELAEALEAWRDHDIVTQIRYAYKNPDGTETVLYAPQFLRSDEDGNSVAELGKPVGVASEFADVIIRILDTCERLHIPIAQALIEKHNYNVTRPYRHGGKKA